MNSRLYYKYLSSHIASKWTVLLIDLLIVVVSMLLAYTLQWEISSVTYKTALYSWMGALAVLCCAMFFQVFHTYVGIIRFSSFVDIYRIFLCLTLSYGVLWLGNFCWSLFSRTEILPGSVLFIAYMLTFSLMLCLRIAVKMLYEQIAFDARHSVNVFIYGIFGSGVNVAKALRVSRNNHFRLCGFISDEPDMIGKHSMGCRVYANNGKLLSILDKKKVQTVIVSPDKELELEKSGILEKMQVRNIHVMVLPPLSDCVDDGLIKNIQIDDWLRREPIKVDIRKIASLIEGGRIMIVGAAGAVGKEIVRQLAAMNPYRLILVDQAESPLYDVQLELSDHWKNLDVKVQVADVTNRTRMESIFRQNTPQIVFHAAAYNNVELMNDYVSEAIRTNVEGSLNVVEMSVKYGVSHCVLVSTDRAAKHETVVDTSKWLAEVAALASAKRLSGETAGKKIMVVRFSDVYPFDLHSLITMQEACQLVLEVCNTGENGAVYMLGEKPEASVEHGNHIHLMNCKPKEMIDEQMYSKIISLIQDSYTESRITLQGRINSFSKTSI